MYIKTVFGRCKSSCLYWLCRDPFLARFQCKPIWDLSLSLSWLSVPLSDVWIWIIVPQEFQPLLVSLSLSVFVIFLVSE